MARESQDWADQECLTLEQKHSECEENGDDGGCFYSELLTSRKASRIKLLPQGREAADWVWTTWFGGNGTDLHTAVTDEGTFGFQIADHTNSRIGFAISYIVTPSQCYAFAVSRFLAEAESAKGAGKPKKS